MPSKRVQYVKIAGSTRKYKKGGPAYTRARAQMQASPATVSPPKGLRYSKCGAGYAINPATGNCIKVGGPVYRSLVRTGTFKAKSGYYINPATGHVGKTGSKQYFELVAKGQIPAKGSAPKKPKSPKAKKPKSAKKPTVPSPRAQAKPKSVKPSAKPKSVKPKSVKPKSPSKPRARLLKSARKAPPLSAKHYSVGHVADGKDGKYAIVTYKAGGKTLKRWQKLN